ncbi:hypothetical protein MASR2M39_19580 [Ignavibacteriales bacterium]
MKEQFVLFPEILENYLIRRYIMGIATNQLNKIFALIAVVKVKNGDEIAKASGRVPHNKRLSKRF